jgi:molybdate/tungstate transport system substrate-binding protein
MRSSGVRRAAALITAFAAASAPAGAQWKSRTRALTGPLVVSSAGSLAASLGELLADFVRAHPGVTPRQTSAGSVESARRAADPATVPDVLALADVAIIPRLLVPTHATWYAAFARNAMVLAYTDRSAHARELTTRGWPDVLLRRDVRAGHSDPALDPAGYRARLVFQLAERAYHRPGLSARLDAAVPTVLPPAGETILSLLQRGALDYIVVYRTTALERGLRYLELPPALDLSDPALANRYAEARIRVASAGSADSLELRGESILYGVTVPARAPDPAAAHAFVRLLLSPRGRAVLERHGFVVPPRPTFGGPGPVPADVTDGTTGARTPSRRPRSARR